MRSIFTFFLTLTIGFIHAQDLTGVWQGHFRASNLNTRNSILDDRYKFEVQIAQRDKTLEAGKLANVVVTSGDPLELQTQVKYLFIKGQLTSTANRHSDFYEQYRKRPKPAQ